MQKEQVYDPTETAAYRNRTMVTTRPAPVAASNPAHRGFGILENAPKVATIEQLATFEADYKLALGDSIRKDAARDNAKTGYDEINATYKGAKTEDRKAMQPEYDAAKSLYDDAEKDAKEASDKAVAARILWDDAKAGKPVPVVVTDPAKISG